MAKTPSFGDPGAGTGRKKRLDASFQGGLPAAALDDERAARLETAVTEQPMPAGDLLRDGADPERDSAEKKQRGRAHMDAIAALFDS